jgi:single stranded DNA-binding protein
LLSIGDRHGKRSSYPTSRAPGRGRQARIRQRPRRQDRQGRADRDQHTRRGSGEAREEESTAIQWTLWGKQAENAAEYLGKGSHVNIVGRLRNNNYEKDGETVYGMAFTAEEIDYLDSRAESEARRNGGPGAEGGTTSTERPSAPAASRKPRTTRQPAHADA